MTLNWLVDIAQKSFRWLVPAPQERLPNTTTIALVLSNAYLVPYYYLCYLSRRRNTYTIRLLLLPVIAVSALKGTFSFGAEYSPNNHLPEWARGLGAITILATSLDLAFSREGRLKVGESELPERREVSHRRVKDVKGHRPSRMQRIFPQWILDICDVAFSTRGVGWKYGQGTPIPEERRSRERGAFLRETAITAIIHWCLLDATLSTLAILPGVGTPPGGSIYFDKLSPVPRHLLAFALTAFSGGIGLLSSMVMEYSVLTIFAVVVLGHSPSSWPPLFDSPWKSTSVHDFWGKRWHQGLRRTFLVFGGYPGQRIAGQVGLVLGAFTASGLYHEYTMYLVNRGVDHRVTFFYAVQSIGIFLEKLFTKLTGRKVGGPFGWLWAFIFIVGTAQLCIDSWFVRGLAAAPIMIPASLSPCRRFLFPLFQNQIDSIVSILS